ncbi:MAG: histone H1 [Proteobacteria bacterium]|nr:histone H1 [Pseudomonadota bacterium]
MTKKTNPRKDFTQHAFDVFQKAIGEVEPEKGLVGKKLDSQKGGLKGGKARAERLTPQERSEIARKAAAARWSKSSKQDI